MVGTRSQTQLLSLKRVAGRQALGDHGEESDLCRYGYQNAWERNMENTSFYVGGRETKDRVQPATHLSRTRAGRSRIPEKAELGKQTTTPRRLSGLPAYDSQVPAVGSAGFSRTDYNSL